MAKLYGINDKLSYLDFYFERKSPNSQPNISFSVSPPYLINNTYMYVVWRGRGIEGWKRIEAGSSYVVKPA